MRLGGAGPAPPRPTPAGVRASENTDAARISSRRRELAGSDRAVWRAPSPAHFRSAAPPCTIAAMRIGQILVAAGRLSPAQLDEALRAQVLYGGRLGTNLVELGHVDLD